MENLDEFGWRRAWDNNGGLHKREIVWVKHYSSSQRILLVGEGDFSFSLSLALSFHSAFNIFATSLDSYNTLVKKYSRTSSNLEQLRVLGATIVHGVDATEMKDCIQLCGHKFDRIVFNFPHAGFYGKEDNPDMIKMHKDLLRGFFSNSQALLHIDGEVHVSHKTSAPYSYLNLEELARENYLVLIEYVPFDILDYPYYQNKRGHGLTSDAPFLLGDCSTFNFALFVHFNTNPMKLIVKGSIGVPFGGYTCALVNSKNSIVAVFRGPLEQVDRDVVELLAVKQALLRFECSEFCPKVTGIVVESDSRNVVSWVKSKIGNPRELQPILEEIAMAISCIGNVEIRCSFRDLGGGIHHYLVDWLAEQGFDEKRSFELGF